MELSRTDLSILLSFFEDFERSGSALQPEMSEVVRKLQTATGDPSLSGAPKIRSPRAPASQPQPPTPRQAFEETTAALRRSSRRQAQAQVEVEEPPVPVPVPNKSGPCPRGSRRWTGRKANQTVNVLDESSDFFVDLLSVALQYNERSSSWTYQLATQLTAGFVGTMPARDTPGSLVVAGVICQRFEASTATSRFLYFLGCIRFSMILLL